MAEVSTADQPEHSADRGRAPTGFAWPVMVISTTNALRPDSVTDFLA
jgi:hypothetical protein